MTKRKEIELLDAEDLSTKSRVCVRCDLRHRHLGSLASIDLRGMPIYAHIDIMLEHELCHSN